MVDRGRTKLSFTCCDSVCARKLETKIGYVTLLVLEFSVLCGQGCGLADAAFVQETEV